MTWKKIKHFALFILIYSLAISLIEYRGEWLLDMAGDTFGSLGLMIFAVIYWNN